MFARIVAERRASIKALLEILETSQLRDGNPFLDRVPYIDPLNHFQVAFLNVHRQGSEDPKILRGLLLVINSISAGLRNSG